MKKDIADQWVAALRSGEYAQATGRLERLKTQWGGEVGFCCLGVLSHLASKEGVCERKVFEGEAVAKYSDGIDGWGEPNWATSLPGRDVMAWAGLRNKYGSLTNQQEGEESLTGMNDGYDKFGESVIPVWTTATFAEIADHIEANWERL